MQATTEDTSSRINEISILLKNKIGGLIGGPETKKPYNSLNYMAFYICNGGEGGIRTLGPSRDAGFQDRYIRPALSPLQIEL